MVIRNAKSKDIEECLKFQKADNENYWEKKDFKLALEDENVVFLVAENCGKVVGYVIGFHCPTKKSDVMLHETRILKSERGKGIGTLLVKKFCDEAFKRGARDIYALIEKDLESFYINSCKFNKSHVWIEVKKTK